MRNLSKSFEKKKKKVKSNNKKKTMNKYQYLNNNKLNDYRKQNLKQTFFKFCSI